MMLSICICTYNRSPSLARMLDSLSPAVAGMKNIEIVIVDNNSDDDTAQTVAHFARTLPIRYRFEPRQGLSVARNTAVRMSNGDLVLFTDDDTHWQKDSISALLDDAEGHPDVGFFGGRVLPQWPVRPPSWLHDPSLDLLAGVLVHYDLGMASRTLRANDPLPYGANFAVFRNILEQVGPFDETLGAIGMRRRRGEDTDLLQRTVKLGYSGWYCADSLCMHRVDPDNLKLRKLFALGVEKGLLLERTHGSSTRYRFDQGLVAIRALAQLFKGRGDRFRQCVIVMGIHEGQARKRHD